MLGICRHLLIQYFRIVSEYIMDLRDFSEIGQQIERTVKNAVDSMNFDKLNQNINETFNNAFKSNPDTAFHYKPKNPFENTGADSGSSNRYDKPKNRYHEGPYRYNSGSGHTSAHEASGNSRTKAAGPYTKTSHSKTYGPYTKTSRQASRPADTKTAAVGFPVISDPPGRISSILMMVFGYSGLAISGTALIVSLAVSAAIGRFFSVGAAFSIISLPIITISAILAINGTRTHGRLSRFKKYVGVLKGRTFCSLKELAQKVGKSKNYVFKDVRRLIGAGFFPEGHIDEQKTCLMVTDSIYEQYLIAQQGMKERTENITNDAKTDKSEPLTSEEEAAFNKTIASGEVYMQHIREANDAIPDTEISNKLYRMELIIRKIFDYVRNHPEQLTQLRRFIDYYMPTTDKLVTAYKDFDTQPIQGENIKAAKLEISKALDTINDAYEKLYDSMYAEAAMDVASDISVLQTLLAQEGLTKEDFNHGRKDL